MKTKACKLRERIARYIYKRLSPFSHDLEVLYSYGEGDWKLLLSTEEEDIETFVEQSRVVERALGILLFFTLNRTGTVMWNKKKEEGYAKMCQEEAKKKKYPEIPTVYPPVHSQIWHDESKKHFALWKGR